ncbi:hypothetical protein KIN20_022142 [Parelaphostrongylus tenuis]|uniref:Uncharacterized protein n=1 Tax=Parelaphostrongylus tenuis TaxID=148309 RepID=A0AAD5NBF3_PARTN|nr:hypothetical protein KIN20_022138 [Parelaphostrongylus tenuis]KAJ1362549.1 hypothetical protein KIN20_022142 [Parelaphostrongylus tenuis]
MMYDKCVIVGSTVTAICPKYMAQPAPKCMMTTLNIIMADWSRAMWQSVVDQAMRMIATDPFGSHFFAATATVF